MGEPKRAVMGVIGGLARDVLFHRKVAVEPRAVGRKHGIEVGAGRAGEDVFGEKLASQFDADAVGSRDNLGGGECGGGV